MHHAAIGSMPWFDGFGWRRRGNADASSRVSSGAAPATVSAFDNLRATLATYFWRHQRHPDIVFCANAATDIKQVLGAEYCWLQHAIAAFVLLVRGLLSLLLLPHRCRLVAFMSALVSLLLSSCVHLSSP
jgi:hypothetical protein